MTLADRAPAALRIVPQQRRAAQTVLRILRAAMTVLRRTPNPQRDGITIDAIATEANASVPAVYRYFSGVDEVYAALVQQEQARILQQGLSILAARTVTSDADVAATLVDFFVQVYSDLLQAPVVVLYLLRNHHEVAYATFGAACPQVRAVMDRAGLLEDRTLDDVQIVTALSSLASAMKAVVLRDPADIADPALRGRLVQMILGILSTPAANLSNGEPIEWTYDQRPR